MFEDIMTNPIIIGIVQGAIFGGEAALFGYMKDENLSLSWKVVLTKQFWEKFSWSKAFKTVLLGVTLGAIARGYGFIKPEQWTWFTDITGLPQISLPLIMNFANTAVVMGADQFSKFIVRRTPLVRLWNGLKDRVLSLLLTRDKLKEILDAAKEQPKQ